MHLVFGTTFKNKRFFEGLSLGKDKVSRNKFENCVIRCLREFFYKQLHASECPRRYSHPKRLRADIFGLIAICPLQHKLELSKTFIDIESQ